MLLAKSSRKLYVVCYYMHSYFDLTNTALDFWLMAVNLSTQEVTLKEDQKIEIFALSEFKNR